MDNQNNYGVGAEHAMPNTYGSIKKIAETANTLDAVKNLSYRSQEISRKILEIESFFRLGPDDDSKIVSRAHESGLNGDLLRIEDTLSVCIRSLESIKVLAGIKWLDKTDVCL